jgi:rhomboid protease GluP
MWQAVVILNVGLGALLETLRELASLVRRRRPSSWLVPALLLLAASAAAWRLERPSVTAGLLGAFLLLELLPHLGLHRIHRLVDAGRFDRALPWARFVALLHPSRRYRAWRGALAALSGRGPPSARVRPLPEEALFRDVWGHHERGEPELVLNVIEQAGTDEAIEARSLRRRYTEALGLAHGAEGLAAELHRKELRDDPWSRMQLVALAGRTALLDRLFDGTLRGAPDSEKRHWRAVAREAAGGPGGTGALERLAQEAPSETSRRRAQVALERLPRASSPWSETLRRELDATERSVADEAAFGFAGVRSDHWLPWATWAIVLGNLAFFALEIRRGGSENRWALETVGALMPWRVESGEHWRLLTFWWMHYGWLHLAMNVGGLLALGPYVERRLGRVALCGIHGAAAVAGGLWAMERSFAPGATGSPVYLGASGGLLGLFGAVIALALHGWMGSGSRAARKLFLRGMLLFALGCGCDLLIPEVSSALHLVGAGVGFLVASALAGLQTPPVRRRRRLVPARG